MSTMTAAEWMFGIIKKAFAFTIHAEFFNALRIRYLFLLNKSGVALTHFARNHFELRRWVWIIEETAVCMCTHYASAKQSERSHLLLYQQLYCCSRVAFHNFHKSLNLSFAIETICMVLVVNFHKEFLYQNIPCHL